MLCRNIVNTCSKQKLCKIQLLHTSASVFKETENPILRTFRILGTLKRKRPKESSPKFSILPQDLCPTDVDIAIIGGGAIGSSIAYWLKEKTNETALNIVVIEKDPTFCKSSTALSVGGLRQQFSLPENIQMSLYGAEFIRTLKKRFGPNAEVNFTPHGYLVLASENGAEQLVNNSKLQNELGAMNILLNRDMIKERFPWMNVTDVELGCLGVEKEGWFDPWSMLHLLKNGAVNLGTQYIHGEAVDFVHEERRDIVIEGVNEAVHRSPVEVVVKFPDGTQKSIRYALCVIAAGAESGQIAELLRIGKGNGLLTYPLPVERRKRFVYSFNCQSNPPGINTPMTIDHTGAYFRRDGLGPCFIGGMSPEPHEEPETNNLDVNYEYFNEKVWPILANRVPAFNAVKVTSAWSGFYEYNTFDENGIIGPHPYFTNIYIATGFSGHGIQQAPAAGRAIAELILDGGFQTIDLTRLGFDRLVLNKPLLEIGII
ncbi:FAD-dependent oxidoreductase domain-containing protein 1-like [Cylas formicarius]|uniref:FAD-dependent oxidoreductase domain-containing protein 1-like n=1 Tax=Cylas formicarius TaxID=197179 RepID=UPI0029586783|nr:FAD-dependent oxidoreductase domain-containing protein 1-like [Cylas formicarius]